MALLNGVNVAWLGALSCAYKKCFSYQISDQGQF